MGRVFRSQRHDTKILRWYQELGPLETARKLSLDPDYVRNRYIAVMRFANAWDYKEEEDPDRSDLLYE